ncbi:MAG TPA: DUF4407 domain-containing protein [Flavitalea sp.]|nr:DUF4407 domain-containing protein [Flavitalea sp.]
MSANLNGQQNGLYSYDSFGGSARKEDEGNFLWWCAGAHQKLLHDSPSEHSKYSGLGGVILATFVLATLSSGYAVYSVFGNIGWTIAFALIWGIIIFNFDRFLVSTMRKYGISRRKQIWMAVPRLLLAFIIGLTIARPLELKIFEKEINTKVAENAHKKMLLNDSLLQLENQSLMQVASLERDRLVVRKKNIEDTLGRLQQSYVAEADGTGGSQQRGVDQLTRMKQDAFNNARLQYIPELSQLDKSIQVQDSILTGAKSSLEEKRKKHEASLLANVGFLERNKALTDLADEESSVFWTSLLLSLLIILIEIGPILSKLIMPVGPYDVALAKHELLKMAASENEMRRDKELVFDKMKGVYKQKRDLSTEFLGKLNDLQRKHMVEELEKWERGEGDEKDKRITVEELLKRIREKYKYDEENLL